MTPIKLKQHYVGTKLLLACPMTLGAYNEYRGWSLPAGEDANAEGYLVEYQDGGAPNVTTHAGYISWIPKHVFETSYLSMGILNGMAPHQQRVIAEKVQLDSNLAKLGAVLNSGALKGKVSDTEYSLLCEQERVMREYSAILRHRIDCFPSVR